MDLYTAQQLKIDQRAAEVIDEYPLLWFNMIEGGLVMQLHIGSYRNHNHEIFLKFGPDRGADISITSEFTRNLKPLLACLNTIPRLALILFDLDESTCARELAPLAGHYSALKLDPPDGFTIYLRGFNDTSNMSWKQLVSTIQSVSMTTPGLSLTSQPGMMSGAGSSVTGL